MNVRTMICVLSCATIPAAVSHVLVTLVSSFEQIAYLVKQLVSYVSAV